MDFDGQADATLFGSADLLIRMKTVGVRLGAKGLTYRPFSVVAKKELRLFRNTFSVEGVMQW